VSGTPPSFAPTAAEAFLLALIRMRESSNNYTATNMVSTASGAYQFIDGTWTAVAKASSVGTAYSRAKDAPPVDQDYNALTLLRANGPNSSYSWKASGPYPTLAECEFAMEFA
jgi:hypothetical protein